MWRRVVAPIGAAAFVAACATAASEVPAPQLAAQQGSAQLVQQLSARFPETFLGLRFEERPEFTILALFKDGRGSQADASAAAQAAGIRVSAIIAPAAMSRLEEQALTVALMGELRRRGLDIVS